MMLGLSETMDQIAKEKSVCWFVDVLMMKDGHVLRRAS